jgi:hypothetical protein
MEQMPPRRNAFAKSPGAGPPCEPHQNPARTEPRPPGITKGHLGSLDMPRNRALHWSIKTRLGRSLALPGPRKAI